MKTHISRQQHKHFKHQDIKQKEPPQKYQIISAHYETGKSVRGAKTGEPRDKPPGTHASRTWLVSYVTSMGLEPTPRDLIGVVRRFSDVVKMKLINSAMLVDAFHDSYTGDQVPF